MNLCIIFLNKSFLDYEASTFAFIWILWIINPKVTVVKTLNSKFLTREEMSYMHDKAIFKIITLSIENYKEIFESIYRIK